MKFSFVVFTGRPDQVHNCTLTNISMTSLTVKCTDGFNGGLPQSFMLEIKDQNSYVSKLCKLLLMCRCCSVSQISTKV